MPEYNGVNITQIYECKKPLNATVSFGNTRILFNGIFGVDRTTGSYRYGDEILLAMFMRGLPKIESRCSQKGYSRIQINISVEEAKTILREALKALEKAYPTQTHF